MTVQLKLGTVVDTGDITNTGLFYANFEAADSPQPVKYVSPYGTKTAAFIAIPEVNSEILAFYDNDPTENTSILGYYYIGSIISSPPGQNYAIPTSEDISPEKSAPTKSYTPSDKVGLNLPTLPGTPHVPRLEDTVFAQKSWGVLPLPFKGMYESKKVIPQQIGMSSEHGDSLMFSTRSNSTTESDLPFQDYKVTLQSGKGKKLQLTDSPIVDGLTYSNEHTGLDYLIWCSKSNVNSPFSEGEFHMRTHGPVNLYTLWSRFHIWIEDGYNIDLENKSSDSKAFLTTGPKGTPRHSDRRRDSEGKLMSGLPDPGTGPYSSRKGVFGNQTTGCINLLSHNNNITLRAMNPDSVIYINAPGERCKVIIDTGGSVDINADKKITIQSKTEVEINAPLVDINGSTLVDIHGAEIYLNDPDRKDKPNEF